MTEKQPTRGEHDAARAAIAGKLKLLRALANFSLSGCPEELRGRLENQREQIRNCVLELEQELQQPLRLAPEAKFEGNGGAGENSRLISEFVRAVVPKSMQSAWRPDSFSGSLLILFEDGQIVSSSLVETKSGLQFGLVDDDDNAAAPRPELAVQTFTVLKSRGKAGVNIYYDLPEATTVTVRIYDARETLVRQIANTYAEAGAYTVAWNGLDDMGVPLPPGNYFCQVRTGNIESELKEIDLR